MANLSTKIKMYAAANGVASVDFTKDVLLQDDMIDGVSNPYIKEWNLDIAKPTDEQLATYNSAATTEEKNNVIRNTRKISYGSLGDQLDLIYKDIVAGKLDTTGEWAKKIKAVKDANPKE